MSYNLPAVLAWKFSGVSGITCRENEERTDMECIAHPDGIPSQAQIDQWTAEYEAAGGVVEEQKEREAERLQRDPIIKAIVKALNKGTFIPGSNHPPAELKAIIKAEL